MELISVKRNCKRCELEFGYEVPRAKGVYAGFLHRDYCYPCIDIMDREEKERAEAIHQERLRYNRHRMVVTCGIPLKYLEEKEALEGFEWKGNKDCQVRYMRWLQDFPAEGKPEHYPSMLLYSQEYGVGKTRLASAILRELIKVWREDGRDVSPYRFWTMPDVFIALQQGQRFGSDKSSQDVYKELSSCRLLVLDDVGKEAKRDYGDVYYKIINDRYNAQLPLILTANLHPTKPWVTGGVTLSDIMGGATVSRLKEMCQGNIIEIKGEDRR